MLFTHAMPHTKSKGLRLTSLNIYLVIFTRATPHTKSKGLPIDALSNLIHFIHTDLADPD
jgi:hypothetical protein